MRGADGPRAIGEVFRLANAISLAKQVRVALQGGRDVDMIRSERLFSNGQRTQVQWFRQVVSGHLLMNIRKAVDHLSQADVIASYRVLQDPLCALEERFCFRVLTHPSQEFAQAVQVLPEV